MKTKKFIGLLIGVMVTFLIAGCDTTEPANNTAVNTMANNAATNMNTMTNTAPAANMSPAADGAEVRVADITGNPNNYVGKTVTVVADVEEVWGARAFSLDEDAPLAGGIDNDLVVLGAQTTNLGNIDNTWRDTKVRVTGTVKMYVLAEIEKELGWDLDPQIEKEIEEKEPVIIASSVEKVSGS